MALLLGAAVAVGAAPQDSANEAEALSRLEAGFHRPPSSARPWVHWFWIDGNITAEGITADLEAMERVGLGGVILMDISHENPTGAVACLSPEWHRLLNHTISEAARLKLEFSINNGPGYSGSGGPWITPELAMQKLVWSTTNVIGPALVNAALPDLPTYGGFNRDVAVLAFPAGRGPVPFLPTGKSGMGRYRGEDSLPAHLRKAPATSIPRNGVRDLSTNFSAGRLSWQVPPGTWTVLRLGSMPTGRENPPARPGGFGLECDKLSKEAVEVHFNALVAPLLSNAPPAARHAFTFTHIDSWEVGYQNWTPLFAQEFRRLRGYDPGPFLPAFTGRVLDSQEVTDRFLWDVRRTISDLQASNYVGHLAALARSHGLKLSAEAYGNGPFDDLLYASKADVPMSEFWNETDDYTKFHTSKAMASAAHVFGKPIVAAESFTAWPANARWRNHPFSLKMLGDTAFTFGVNHIVFHRYAHQPWLSLRPGMTMGHWGVHYERTQTWWEHSKPWHEYLARCQHLLQNTRFAADLLYLSSENAYTTAPALPELSPPPPAGYDYDLAPPEALFTRLSVVNGKLRLPTGAEYRVLVLPPVTTMTPALLQRIAQLVEDGATVVGRPPSHSPSLVNYPESDRQLQATAAKLWGKSDGSKILENRFGKGRVVWGKPLDRLLAEMQCPPDFAQLAATPKPLRRIHQQLGTAGFYFIANPNSNAVTVECRFRVSQLQPELWDPSTGKIETCVAWRSDPSGTFVRLDLDPLGSCFVVFRREADPGQQVVALSSDGKPADAEVTAGPDNHLWLRSATPGNYEARLGNGATRRAQITGALRRTVLDQPWSVRFPPGSGAPGQIQLPRVAPLHQHPELGVRHFSGVATYQTRFLSQAPVPDTHRVYLDLGHVEVTAAIRVNGHGAGVLWKPPFRADVTTLLRAGENTLEVDVATRWPNRLIGDEYLPDDCEWVSPEVGATGTPLKEWPVWLRERRPRPSPRIAFATRRFWAKDEPLLPSGLIGPVQMVTEAVVPLR